MDLGSREVRIGTHGAFSCDFLTRKNVKDRISQVLEQHIGRRCSVSFVALADDGEGQGDLFGRSRCPATSMKMDS